MEQAEAVRQSACSLHFATQRSLLPPFLPTLPHPLSLSHPLSHQHPLPPSTRTLSQPPLSRRGKPRPQKRGNARSSSLQSRAFCLHFRASGKPRPRVAEPTAHSSQRRPRSSYLGKETQSFRLLIKPPKSFYFLYRLDIYLYRFIYLSVTALCLSVKCEPKLLVFRKPCKRSPVSEEKLKPLY